MWERHLKEEEEGKKTLYHAQVGQAPHFISDSILDSISERQIREAKKSKLRMTGQPQL